MAVTQAGAQAHAQAIEVTDRDRTQAGAQAHAQASDIEWNRMRLRTRLRLRTSSVGRPQVGSQVKTRGNP